MLLITFQETAQRMGFKSRSVIYDLLADKVLTQPIQIGERALRFPSHEVDAIIKARIAGKPKSDIQALVKQLEADRAKLIESAQPKRKANPMQLVEA